jgi:hypothetical protein
MKKRIRHIEPKEYKEMYQNLMLTQNIQCCYPNCHLQFSSMSEYSKHFNIHYNPNLKCPYPKCSKVFKAFSRLKRHLFVHSKKKYFICSICKTQFTLDYNMRAHFRKHFLKQEKFTIKKPRTNTNRQKQDPLNTNNEDIQRCTFLIREIFKNVLSKYNNDVHK